MSFDSISWNTPLYWITECGVIFVADVLAAGLVYWFIDARVEKHKERGRRKQFNVLAWKALTELNNWFHKTEPIPSVQPLSRYQREIPDSGLGKIFDPAANWDFKDAYIPINELIKVDSSVRAWNQEQFPTKEMFLEFRERFRREIDTATNHIQISGEKK